MSYTHTSDITHEITLRLPEAIVERLQSAAEDQHIPVEQVVSEALDVSLPPARIRREAEERMETAIHTLSGLTAAQLKARTQAKITPEEKRQTLELIARSKMRELSAEEEAAMEILFKRTEEVATERAAALWLLRTQHRKNESVP